MDSALRDMTWKDLDIKLEEMEDTIGKKRKLEVMLRKAKEEQGTVPEYIYEKVASEYQKQLGEILTVIEPLEADIEAARKSVSLEIAELETVIASAQDTLAEIEFRFKVGEFDEATFAEKQTPLQNSLDEKIGSKQSLMNSLKKYDSFIDALHAGSESTPDAEPVEPTVPELAENPADESAQPSPAEPSEPAEQRAPDPDFVNPNEWLEDFAGTTEKASENESDSRRKTDSALFEDLLETTPDTVLAAHEPAHAPADGENPRIPSSDNTPLLIMKSKTGNDKCIPVLPITLTIGREHDNNIEIKDEEAARYHARIVFKSGQYILQSLENARSTLVNGKHITEAVLQDADTITIGKTKMFFMMK